MLKGIQRTLNGSLKVDVDASEQEEVAQKLLEDFNCVPTFLPHELQKRFYLGFCKQQLWPLFHYMLPVCPDHGDRFDRLLWKAYVSANKIFSDKVMEIINPEEDYVWVHDYHLMVLPTFLRKRYNRVKLGFFLHSPFPSSEIYRTLPVRDEILRGLLNSDLIGFHTFDYARHFLSCCSRMLGLDYESKRGHIGLDYFGRTIFIKILPVGVHMGRLESVLNLSATSDKVKEIQEAFNGRKLILGIDDMDIFKGISLKLLAVEQLLQQHQNLRGEIVLVQIVNPARGFGKDVQEAKKETYSIAQRINCLYGSQNYQPVILIDRPVPRFEKSAYYAVAECCIVNAVRDGMNLVPYKYIVCRQGTPRLDVAVGRKTDSPRTSMLVVSEFIGCSPSLSGAIRVNPWDIDAVADALNLAITMHDSEKQLRHEKHYRYVSSHDVAYWACSFMQDLERACQDHYSKRCWGIGFGLGFRVVSLSPGFRKLSIDHIVSAYKRTNRRAIFLDYDGTVVPQSSIIKIPSPEVISVLNTLCNDPKNTVFIVSGRGRDSLSEWFSSCQILGIAAEHGYFLRWSKNSEWETIHLGADLGWIKIAEPVMRLYTEATDGSNIEVKESAMVWHHQDADPDFGLCQAKELMDHLESVLANEPAVVNRGQHIVEAKPQGVSKGLVAENVLSTMVNSGDPPDFVLCIGDDRSDEDMFESILRTVSSPPLPVAPEIFACTVGRKPSKAKYYLDDATDVVKLLQGLATASNPKPRHLAHVQVSFESTV
ncbi:Trehalose-6-phosphate synthase-6 [Quillaja saponaria]|uniref:Trehalose-6-phosphate synthase-6 n=1 Tax=Quillaja saponaria TaxID=32244 RepID=A0AAD7L8L7_QUISA|nr:Trehalose-6-phosphate synthase-6 [Quillaja saponaria]